jgi:hypothetical protein
MDLCLDEPTDRTSVINNWRLYFKVLVLSDILNADGTQIIPIYLTFPTSEAPPSHPERESLRQLPNQGKASERRFTYWKIYVMKVANCDARGRVNKRLVNWTIPSNRSNNKWYSYMDTTNVFIYNASKAEFDISSPTTNRRSSGTYQVKNTSTRDIPSNSYPITVTHDRNLIKIMHVCSKVSVTPSRIPTAQTFEQYLDKQQLWEQRLLSMWWTVHLDDLKAYLRDTDEIIMVSDGGMISSKGSYGVVFGTRSDHIIGSVEGSTKESPLTISSFRSEAYGMLSSFIFIKHLYLYLGINGGNRPMK